MKVLARQPQGAREYSPPREPAWARWKLPLAIALAAVVFRAVLCLVHPFLFPDSADYLALARAIAAGRPYEVHGLFASRMPGYPLLVAAVFKLFGPHVRAVLLVQALLQGVACLVVYRLARRAGRPAAALATALVAVDPLLVAFSAALLTEAPFLLFFVLTLLLGLRLAKRPERSAAALGFAACQVVAVYLRPSVVLCLPVLWAWLLLAGPRVAAPRRFAVVGLSFVLLLAALTPWWVRNYRLFGNDFFRLSTLEGKSLYESVYAGATGGPRQTHIALLPGMRHMNEGQQDARWTQAAFRAIEKDPLRIAVLAIVKIGRTWAPWLDAPHYRNRWFDIPLALWYIMIDLLAFAGVAWGRIPRRLLFLLLIPVLYFTALHAVFLGSVRYRVPIMPILDLLAAAGAVALVGGQRPIFRRAGAMASSAGAATRGAGGKGNFHG